MNTKYVQNLHLRALCFYKDVCSKDFIFAPLLNKQFVLYVIGGLSGYLTATQSVYPCLTPLYNIVGEALFWGFLASEAALAFANQSKRKEMAYLSDRTKEVKNEHKEFVFDE